MAKKLKLKPSARDKRRYFLVSEKDDKQVEDAVLEYIGVLGFAKAAYKKVKKTNKGVVGSCLRQSLNDVKAGLAIAGMKVERVSGTLKGLGV